MLEYIDALEIENRRLAASLALERMKRCESDKTITSLCVRLTIAQDRTAIERERLKAAARIVTRMPVNADRDALLAILKL